LLIKAQPPLLGVTVLLAEKTTFCGFVKAWLPIIGKASQSFGSLIYKLGVFSLLALGRADTLLDTSVRTILY
jgi:hypothetical protein